MIITEVFERSFEGSRRDFNLGPRNDRCNRQVTILMILGKVVDNLTFNMVRQFQWTACSGFIKRCIVLLEIAKRSFGNVGDVGNFG